MSFTFAGMILELARERPDATALIFEDQHYSFAQLKNRGTRLAHALRGLGIGSEDRVGFLGRNCPQFFELTLACSLLNAVVVGLNWRLSPDEIAAITADARLKLVVASANNRALLDKVMQTASAPRLVDLDTDLESLLAASPSDEMADSSSTQSVLYQLYSSGTTGLPKGILITNQNLSFTQLSGRRLYGMDQRSVNLAASPLFHIGGAGYALTAMSQGGATVLVSDSKPTTLLEAISRHRVTHTFLVPTVIHDVVRYLADSTLTVNSLRVIAYGGAPMSETLLVNSMSRLGCSFLGVYGLTETAGTVVSLAPEDHDPVGPKVSLLRSIGKPLSWAAEVEIRDPQSLAELPAGQVGEIWVRSGQVTPGYWQQPRTTAQALTADGWLRTGDAAYKDDAGYLFLKDRIKDMIITGGENVYPAEVENALSCHPAVLEVAVIGVPSARWGETVKALVVCDPAATVCEAELIAFSRERIAHYKCPTSVDFVAQLPRNAAGKVLKQVLRQRYRPA